MYPTRGQIKQQAWYLLDDPNGQIFIDYPPQAPTLSNFQAAFQEAYDALYAAMLGFEVPRITLLNVQQGSAGSGFGQGGFGQGGFGGSGGGGASGFYILPAYQTSVTPAQMGISNFGQYEWIAERIAGSSDRFVDLTPRDRLDQLSPTDHLREFVFRNDTFYFIGATYPTELKMMYETSGVCPTTDTSVIPFDGILTFLSNYAAGRMGPTKGRNELAQIAWETAVGPKYSAGQIGGALFRLIQPQVRQRQKVQMAHKPYTAGRRLQVRFQVPWVAAQQGTTGGGATNVPIEVSTAGPSPQIIGAINGVNATFVILTSGTVQQMVVYRNGIFQTYGLDYVWTNNQITFLGLSIPQPGPPADVITAEIYLNWNMPGA